MKSIEKHWALALALTFVAVAIVFFGNSRSKSTARAETKVANSAGSTTFAVPIQLSRDNYGLAMFDVSARTVWIYEFSNRGPAQTRLRLLAARSFQYDQLLTDYNTTPRPKEIKNMLEGLSHSQTLPQNPEEELERQAQPE
jgi:hypothetical protein